jgi:PAS domain S-box-containing protein
VTTNIRVLILEDRTEDAELMVHELQRSQFEPDWRRVDTESEYNAHLGWQPDVILSDYNMPLLDAPRALDLLQQLDLDIPFIVVSGAIGEDVAVAMMRRGATDYLLKDRLTRLGPAVRRAIEERELRAETTRAERALRASEIRFYSFMNNNPALALIKDRDGRILYINNTSEPMWGLTPAECLGKTNYELWPADVAGRLHHNDQTVLASGEASRIVEEVFQFGRGSSHMLSFRFPFAEADGGQLLGMVSIDVSEQMRTQKALSAALAAKEVLLKEVHHRVKNNLQVISSLLSMQAESLEDPAVADALRESQQRVQCMALIHERLNQDDQTDRLDFPDYVESLARDLFYCYGAEPERIRLAFELEAVWLPLSQAIPSGLILNEVLTNAFKYAFPAGRTGEILIALKCGDDGLIRLAVSDNGVGLPAGFDWKASPSLGLRIVDILRRQLEGSVQFEAGGNGGAAFVLTFPRAADQAQAPPRESWAETAVASGAPFPARKPAGRVQGSAAVNRSPK